VAKWRAIVGRDPAQGSFWKALVAAALIGGPLTWGGAGALHLGLAWKIPVTLIVILGAAGMISSRVRDDWRARAYMSSKYGGRAGRPPF
jgi:hypothetical protein